MGKSRFFRRGEPVFLKFRGEVEIRPIKRTVPPPPEISEGVLLLETGTDDLLFENSDRVALE